MNAPASLSNRLQKAKLTVEDFLLLYEHGAFDSYSKVELIEGEIYFVNAAYARHGYAQLELGAELRFSLKNLGSDLRTFTAIAIRMPASVPESDIVIALPVEGKTMMHLSHVALAVEISDSTLKFDLSRKLALYAREGIAEYWVVDIKGRKVHQFWAPDAGKYAENREVEFGQRIESATIPGLGADTASL
jgi:Uma2 family endonuclease